MVQKRKNKGKSNSSYALARKALDKVNQLEKEIEVKHHTDNLTQIIGTGVTYVKELTAIGGNGDNNEEHIGDNVTLKRLSVKHGMDLPSADFGTVRVICVRILDRMTAAEKTAFAATDILDLADGTSFYKLNSLYKFRVLKDSLYHFSSDHATGMQKNYVLSVKDTEYNQDGVTSAGTIFCITINDTTGSLVQKGNFRISYTDA